MREPDVEIAPMPNPTVAQTHRPVKRETPIEQTVRLVPPNREVANIEGLGPIRPTMMESGREAPSPSPAEDERDLAARLGRASPEVGGRR